MDATPKETTQEKAVRLVATDNVRVVGASAETVAALVRGDTVDEFGERPRYRVELNGRWTCTCPHGCLSRKLCSHALAVQMIYRAVRPALR